MSLIFNIGELLAFILDLLLRFATPILLLCILLRLPKRKRNDDV